ncbi:tetratricopeptide repeat protein [Paludibacterium purpuratum]|uniref:tetratricopeptide repeat protein n=1 Tax=Paludibacterium purpuratum TaxID=1144873 RepID=UPI001414E2C5|nr:tetratricopeptide repeat protein [Paludibacterium purpuratum]
MSLSAWGADQCVGVTGDARQALERGDAVGAQRLLQAAEASCAGNAAFDQLLGFVLLRNDQAAEASWVLERAVAANPRNGAAWLDLADAGLRLGDTERAQEALQRAVNLNPPPSAQQKIAVLRDALQHMNRRWSFDGYFASEAGWDSNVNSATDLTALSAPGFSPLPIKLDPDSRQEGSSYADVELGGTLAWRADDALTLYLLPKAKSRSFLQRHQFDRAIFGLQGGVGWRLGDSMLIALLQSEDQQLSGQEYLHSEGGVLEWRLPLSNTRQLSLTSQFTSTRYADPKMRNYDSDQLLAGLSLTQLFWQDRLRWMVSAYRGEDDGVNNRAGGSRRMVILSSDLGYKLLPELDAHLALTHESDAYRKIDPGFLRPRNESIWNYSATLAWQCGKQHTLTAGYTYIRDDASIVLYTSHRQIVSLGWRAAF